MATFLRHFCVLYFQRAACSTFQTCIVNSHWYTSTLRALRLGEGKNEERKIEEETTGQKYNGLPCSIGQHIMACPVPLGSHTQSKLKYWLFRFYYNVGYLGFTVVAVLL